MADSGVCRSFRYTLAPTPEQAEALGRAVGACRWLYNLALEQRRDWWRQYQRNTGRSISYIGQTYELTQLRAEAPWLRAVPREALDASLKQLQRAYDAFFFGRASYPTMRKRGDGCGFTLRGKWSRIERLNAKWGRVRLGTLGWVKLRMTRAIVGTPKTVSIREEAGRWYVSVSCEFDAEVSDRACADVGIDRGVANTLALSTGELLRMPASVEAIRQRRRKAQRVLARRKKGSVRRGKQKARVAALWARERRARNDWLHRISTDISRRFGLVAIEALKIKGMTASAAGTPADPGTGVAQKRGLNRSILEQGWGTFERQLAYKLETTGGALIRVPASYTSQTCSSCGAVDAESRESQAVFRCVHCGHEAHADTNAALEILRRSTSAQLVEGAHQRPREARTTREAA